jgi:flagellar biosynthesis component FlhA
MSGDFVIGLTVFTIIVTVNFLVIINPSINMFTFTRRI